MEKISIIIPAYNSELYLEKCLDSVIKQTYSNIEIILVNDGSTDNTGEICAIYDSKYDNIHYIQQENQGVSFARNVGINAATGEYIGFVDSDDYVEPTMFEYMMNIMKNEQLDLLSCGVYINDTPVSEHVSSKFELIDVNNALKMVLTDDQSNTMYPFVNNKLFKKDTLQKILFFDTEYSIGEDMLVTIKALLKCERIGQVKIPLYHYVQNENSCVHTYSKKKQSSVLVHKEIQELLKNYDESLELLAKQRSIIQSWALWIEALMYSSHAYTDGKIYLQDIFQDNGKFLCTYITGLKLKILFYLSKYTPRTLCWCVKMLRHINCRH